MFKLESLNSDKIGIIVKNPTKEVKDFLISIVMDQNINSKNYHAKTSVSPFVQHNSEDLLFIELLIGSEKDRQEYIDYLNREYAVKDIKTEPGMMDANECRDSILFHAKNIAESDLTSTTVTKGRIESLRSVLDLFERYNDQLEGL